MAQRSRGRDNQDKWRVKARKGFSNRRFERRFWVLLPPRAKVPRAGARNASFGKGDLGADDPVRPSPTQSARLPRRRRLDNRAGMGIIKMRGRCDKRSALYDNDFFRKKPSPCRVAVSAFYDDRDRERPDM